MPAQTAGTDGGPANKPEDTYPRPNPKQRFTASQGSLASFLLSGDTTMFQPDPGMSGFAAACQSVTRVCGQLSQIVNAASTSVVLVRAIENNVPGFALTIAASATVTALNNAGYDTKNIVSTVMQRANDIVSSPMKFLEQVFRAKAHAQASFTGAGIADLLTALGSVSNLLYACKTFTDLITGGVTARFGPNNENTENSKRLRAAGISIGPTQIRAGLDACAMAMRDFGLLWDPNEPYLVGTPNGMALSLKKSGIAELCGLRQALLNQGVFIDDDDNIRDISKFVILDALRTIDGDNLQIIIERTGCRPAQPQNVRTAADLCNPAVICSQTALDNIPYGDLTEFGKQIALMNCQNRVTFEMLADTLDKLELPDLGLIDNPTFASDMANLKNYVGHGSGLFGQPGINDLLGTVGGTAHREAFQLLSDANTKLESTGEGKALKVALDYYNSYHTTAGDFAETNLIAAIEAIGTSTDPVVRNAVAVADKSMLDSAIQIVNEITNAVTIGYGIYGSMVAVYAAGVKATNLVTAAITKAGAGLGSPTTAEIAAIQAAQTAKDETVVSTDSGAFTMLKGMMAALRFITTIVDEVMQATGIDALIEACCNPNSRAGQAMLMMIAEARNNATLSVVGMKTPEIDVAEHAREKNAENGFGLTLEQQRIITAYASNEGLGGDDLKALFKMSAYFGYQRHFFETVAGLYEVSRAQYMPR